MGKRNMLYPDEKYKKSTQAVIEVCKKVIFKNSPIFENHYLETKKFNLYVWKDAEKMIHKVSKEKDLDKSFLIRNVVNVVCFYSEKDFDFEQNIFYPIISLLRKRYTESKENNYKFSKRSKGNNNKRRRNYVLSVQAVRFIDQKVSEHNAREKLVVDDYNQHVAGPEQQRRFFRITRSDVIREIILFFFCGELKGTFNGYYDYPKAVSQF